MTDIRVTPERIDALMHRLVARVSQPAGTTSTFVHMFLDDRFYVSTGHSACVDPAAFDPAYGINLAKKEAIAKARDQLWVLEGYALFKEMNNV
jgi:hypothetical protein